MKIKISSFIALLIFTSPLYAGSKTDFTASNLSHWNPISIYNNTENDIAYLVNGSYGGVIYGIPAGAADLYHSGFGDSNASFDVALCTKVVGDRCIEPSPAPVKPCTPDRYNAEEIHSIRIDSLTSCTVVCNDGTATSCKL